MSGNAYSLGGMDASVVHVNLATTFIGATFNSFFFAVATIQTAYYWQHYWKNDKLYLRCMVMLVTILNAFHMAFYTYTLWRVLIPSHAGASGSSGMGFPWSTYAQFVANAMGIFAVHTFYLHRLWTFSQNRFFITMLGVFMLEVFALAMYVTIYAITNPIASILASIANLATVLSASLAVTDVTTTTSLVTLILRLSNSDMKSQRLAKRLIFYTLTTGVLTAVCAVVALITNLKFPHTTISGAFYDLGASLYACSFLSSLNARQDLRGKLMETDNGFSTGDATMPYFPRFATSGTFAGLTTTANTTRSRIHACVEQDTAVYLDPARCIGERPRTRSNTSKEAPPSHHDSECSFFPSTGELDA